ncbi:MAG: helix-turn-helix transcriptional regulator [Cyclobacteriaceae bacterium]
MHTITTLNVESPVKYLVESHYLAEVTKAKTISFITNSKHKVLFANRHFCEWLQINSGPEDLGKINIGTHLDIAAYQTDISKFLNQTEKLNSSLQHLFFEKNGCTKTCLVTEKSIMPTGYKIVTIRSIAQWDYLIGKIDRIIEEEYFVNSQREIYEQLTHREKEILHLISEGYNSTEIADKLFVSQHTVSQHRKNIYRKLGAKTVIDLCRFGRLFA